MAQKIGEITQFSQLFINYFENSIYIKKVKHGF